MPRLGFYPGQEALAADLMTLQDGTVHRFSDKAQRDEQWPAPVLGALSLINTSPTQLDIWESENRLWVPLIYKPGATDSQLITQRVTNKVIPSGGYPQATWLQFSNGAIYLIARNQEGNSNVTNCFYTSSSGQYTSLAAPQGTSAKTNSSTIELRANNMDQSLWVLSDFTGTNAGWITGGRNPAAPTRYLLKIYGRVSADNVVAMETRLDRLEALLDLPPIVEPLDEYLEQPPLVPDDPLADPDYEPEVET